MCTEDSEGSKVQILPHRASRSRPRARGHMSGRTSQDTLLGLGRWTGQVTTWAVGLISRGILRCHRDRLPPHPVLCCLAAGTGVTERHPCPQAPWPALFLRLLVELSRGLGICQWFGDEEMEYLWIEMLGRQRAPE